VVTVQAVAVSIALALGCACAHAASIQALSSRRDGGRYTVLLHAHVDASAPAVYSVLADVANWKRLNPDLRQLEILDQHGDGAIGLRTAYEACVLWYCRLIYQVQDMHPAPLANGGDINVLLRPNAGDFRSGQAHWRVRTSGSGTELEFTAEVEPLFSVPPVVGPWLMTRWLRSEAVQTLTNIEALTAAARRAEGPPIGLDRPPPASAAVSPALR
jgi:hypothetical protein